MTELTSPLFDAAIARFDEANRADPNVEWVDGAPHPKELLYAQQLTAWTRRLEPDASEALLLAARSQHLCRWEIPRTDYEPDRKGYLQWRRALQKHHAEKAGAILREAGYAGDTIERVQNLLQKRNLTRDPEVQLLEDAVCLVFLSHQFRAFAEKTPEPKVIEILQKTWKKMTPRGHATALDLELSDRERRLIEKALADAEATAEGS